MFGYILPAHGALSDDDKQIWQSFYCSLCRKIGKKSQIARLGLSYDLTFLALLTAALSEEEPTVRQQRRCVMHPTRKVDIYTDTDFFDYAAAASVILIKAKLGDDANDKKNPIYSLVGRLIKDIEGQSELVGAIEDSLARLADAEQANSCDIDEVADCFACLCGQLFRLSPTPTNQKNALYWLGYNLGRWIYLADAWDDLADDIKKGNYNPFADGRSFEQIKSSDEENVREMLTFTLSEAAAAFDLLNIKRYSSLLENIIYVGLNARLIQIMKGTQTV